MVDKSVTTTADNSVTLNQQLLATNRDLQTALETMDALRQLNAHQRDVIEEQKQVIKELRKKKK